MNEPTDTCCRGGELTAACAACPQPVTLDLCNACLDGAGGECHTPGCALWLSRAPDIPLRDKARQ